MASSSYCQGLQSCLEIEPRVLRLKLAPPETSILPSNSKPPAAGDYDSGGWSFLQSLAKNEPVSKEEVYIPPKCKSGASALSKKSLEMCTESLGSETGSDGGDSGDELNLLSSDYRSEIPAKLRETRRMNRSPSFPPPLSSISGGSAVQMRPRREGGRLVLEAVSASNSSPAYLKVERIDGRLKLHLMKNCDSHEEEKEENEEEEDEENDEEEEEMKENGEFGREKLKRLSRCGSSSLLNWEPFWVAT